MMRRSIGNGDAARTLANDDRPGDPERPAPAVWQQIRPHAPLNALAGALPNWDLLPAMPFVRRRKTT